MSLRNILAFGNTNSIEREVAGETIQFYPISVRMLFRLKKIGKPLAKALAVLFRQDSTDTGLEQKTITDPASPGAKVEEILTHAISPKLADLRHNQSQKAIEELIDSITDPKNVDAMAEIVIDSMKAKEELKPRDLVDQVQIPVFLELAKCVLEANQGVLGPLVERIQSTIGRTVAPPQPPEMS